MFKDRDQLKQRLSVLLGSYGSGNVGNKQLKNEITFITDELLKSEELTKKQHRAIYDKFIK